MIPVHERLAELYTISRQRQLTLDEDTELQQCLQTNAKYCWEMSRLHNMAILAATTSDTVWLQDISNRMNELRLTGKLAKRK